ncbi:NupC/NupG family nucleoside CNT transporter [Terrisporobacter mayombei]|uniref:Nucleoside permease NupX n=1 Tax=Terrisporobacter mayombei TaxID=1541 RepID=A0ABY9PVQ8_9FIRM|nr:nucleoside transporter C-terminal domain-containing protein [Terrisporobacter mayombei]MCC3869873.1 NupC/NupG family nucleoside CNT transporter [Terrisporobacter mayombei]WMT79762.1 Putative nucleoside permease NupX [Terrisporobacter mayombei]
MTILLNIMGIIVLLGVLYLFSANKKLIDKKMILKALALQFVLAFLLVKFPLGQVMIEKVSDVVTNILGYGRDGLEFIFGSLADGGAPTGFIFGIQTLGNIIFISALVSALYYLGVIGAVVKVIGGVIGKILGTSKVESFVATANMFLGQTESPILVSKYLKNMTESEIMLVLVSGMGSMSATVLMGYSGMGIPMKYLLIGGALVPLGSIIVSKIMLPENKELKIDEAEEIKIDNKGDNPNLISAISQGANDGLNMVLGIGASLIAILSLVALVNGILGIFGLSLEQIFSVLFAPIGYLMGLDMNNAQLAGQLLGSKLVLNEFVAFGQLGEIIKTLDPRTALVLSVSLCGFANIGSIGICISGISVFCPEKRNQLAKLAFRGMIGGFTVSVLSALIVGLIAAI